ncbi:MAG: hypothetical protein ACJ8E8_00045 [Sphingomicrobium sp.]
MSLLLSMLLVSTPIYGTKADDLSIEALHNFGACVVLMTPAGAEEVLAMDFRTDEYRESLRRLARGHGRCTLPRTELKFNGVLFAGAMAEALLEQPGGKVLRRLSAADDLAAPLAARSPLEAMALCGVITRPAAVGRLLEAEVTSEAENEAVEALMPTLNACLVGADKAELNRPALRSVMALAAWRIASASESQPQAGGAQ